MCKWCNKEPKTEKDFKDFTDDYNKGKMCQELREIVSENISDYEAKRGAI